MVVVMQRLYPKNFIDVFGIFETRELAEIEVNKAISALYADNPDAHKRCDSLGNYTVYLDYSEEECFQFDFSEVEKNKQLQRTYKGNIDVLRENGWETTSNRVFMWQ